LSLGLLPQSKKIQKLKSDFSYSQSSPSVANSSHETEDSDSEKLSTNRYYIFPTPEKKEITALLKEYIINFFNLSSQTSITPKKWESLLDKLGEKEYIAFIKKTIPLYVNRIFFLEY